MAQLDAEVLATLRDDILRPAVVDRAIALALDALAPGGAADAAKAEAAALVETLEAECRRLAEAIAHSGQLDVLVDTLASRQERLHAVRAALALHARPAPVAFNRRDDRKH